MGRILVAISLILIAMWAVDATVEHSVAAELAKRKAAAKKATYPREPGPLWSARCELKGKRIFATQADGKAWKINCVKAEAL